MSSAPIHLIIPTIQRSALLRRTLGSVLVAFNECPIASIRVVENGPKEGASQVVSEFVDQLPIRYMHTLGANCGLARNFGATSIESGLLLFLDDDITVEKGFFSALAAAYARFSDSRFYGGRVDAEYLTPPDDWLRLHLPKSATTFSLEHDETVEVKEPVFLGGYIAIPTPLFHRLGGFDALSTSSSGHENEGFVGEETRLQQKLLAMNVFGCYVPLAPVKHWVPPDRCNLEWLIARRRRAGSSQAQTTEESLRQNVWVLRLWLKAALKSRWHQALGRPHSAYAGNLLMSHYYGAYWRELMSLRFGMTRRKM